MPASCTSNVQVLCVVHEGFVRVKKLHPAWQRLYICASFRDRLIVSCQLGSGTNEIHKRGDYHFLLT
jgi:hypothetical protein